jgi:tripartite-type tricarboxylate transporter receptor subunit TctC
LQAAEPEYHSNISGFAAGAAQETAMKISRRKFLHLAAGAAAPTFAPQLAAAQAYPARPVRLVVGFAAGSSPDNSARLIAQWLSERLGQQFIVENRPGAGTNIATEAVVKAAPDGYTLLMVGASSTINATLYEKLSFNFIRDIVPVGTTIRLAAVMVVNPSFPASTLPEFIAYARANPGTINMAAATIGGTDYIAGELFKSMTGVRMPIVPYRGGGASMQSDLITGQVQVAFPVTAAALGYIRTGQYRALAVTSAERWPGLLDVPTVGEFVPGYEATTFHGIGAPKHTSADIIDKLNREINAAHADPRMQARFADLGGVPLPGSPAEFGKLIADETEKWRKVIRAANIKVE